MIASTIRIEYSGLLSHRENKTSSNLLQISIVDDIVLLQPRVEASNSGKINTIQLIVSTLSQCLINSNTTLTSKMKCKQSTKMPFLNINLSSPLLFIYLDIHHHSHLQYLLLKSQNVHLSCDLRLFCNHGNNQCFQYSCTHKLSLHLHVLNGTVHLSVYRLS